MNTSKLANVAMPGVKSSGPMGTMTQTRLMLGGLALVLSAVGSTASAQPATNPATHPVVGSTWQGHETYHGHKTPITVWFRPNQEVAVSCENDAHQQVTYYGTYTQVGNQVSVNMPIIKARFDGTIYYDPGVQSGAPAGFGGGPILLNGLEMKGKGQEPQRADWDFKLDCKVYGPQQHLPH